MSSRRPYRRDVSVARRNRLMMEALESRTLMTVTIDGLPAIYGPGITLPAGKSVVVPLTSTNTLSGKVTYTVTASSPLLTPLVNSIKPAVSATRTFVRFSTNFGNMDFQLFNDVAPVTVNYLLSHLSSPDYVNTIFHRIVDQDQGKPYSIIQGGDRDGDGISNDATVALQTEPDWRVLYSGHGQLGGARTQAPDSGGSQFFVTYETQRGFDLNYTIYGQMVRGWNVLDAINSVPTDANDRPLVPPVLNGISVINNQTDAVLTLVSKSLTPISGTITVTAKDALGNQDVQVFNVSTFADTMWNNAPYLASPPSVVNRAINKNTTTTINFGTTVDLEGDARTVIAQLWGNPPHYTASFNQTTLFIKPDTGYTGPIQVFLGVEQNNNSALHTEHLYTFLVDSGAAPTYTARARDVFGSAGGTHTFQVTFTDDTLVNAATLSGNNTLVTVRTPSGVLLPAQFVSMSAGSGSRTVTYRIAAPGGKWDAADAGAYTISVKGGVVKDTLGHAGAARAVGTFYYSPSVFFSERYYLALNGDVAAAVRAGKFKSGWQHFNLAGAAQGRAASPYFNEKLYRRLYPSVDAAVKQGLFKSGWHHFSQYGAKQGLTASPVFSEAQYFELYPDVKAAVQAKMFGSGFEHFLKAGQFEGRKPSLYFDLVAYTASNQVVVNAVNTGAAGLAQTVTEHFLLYGQREGRQANDLYSESYYLARYPDIAAAVTAGQFRSGFEHFILFGAREKRDPSVDFNSNFYLTTYPDVATAIANKTVQSAYEHFLRIGRALGRAGHA